MPMRNRSVLRCYIRDVKNALACSGKMRRSILSQLRKSVEDYLCQDPNADLEAIRSRFGTSQEIAASCMDGQETFTLIRKFRKKTTLITAAAVVAVLLVCAGYVNRNVHSSQEDTKNDVQYIKVETVYHENDD